MADLIDYWKARGHSVIALTTDSVIGTLATPQQPPKARRVCMMCDRYVTKVECEYCGADTERI